MNHNCFNCQHFTAYYDKAYYCFLRTDCGNCSITDTTVKKHSACDSWKSKSPRNKLKKGAILNELARALTTINAIKLILDESENE